MSYTDISAAIINYLSKPNKMTKLYSAVAACFFLLAIQALTTKPSYAEIDGSMGGGFKPYEIDIEGFSCQNAACGMVLVIPEGAKAPKGFESGKVYWAWPKAIPWQYAFTLSPSTRVPKYTDYPWTVFKHSQFDLSKTYPFPQLSLEEEDGFYTFFVGNNPWTQRGWLWLRNRSSVSQFWFGYQLTKPLIGLPGEPIHFIPQAPPPAGSVEIYKEY